MKKQLRLLAGRYAFMREHRKEHRNPRLVPFEEAKSIGILYDSTEEKDFDLVRKYVKEIRETHHKEVLALGYFDRKELPPMRFSKLGLDFFTQSDLNWLFKPVANVVRNFMNREFDILIDLHTGDNIPFRYIVAGSKARFKIGQYDKSYAYLYDFMLSGSERLSFPQYIEQVKHYLNALKYDEKKT
jgi:hypothetical protein